MRPPGRATAAAVLAVLGVLAAQPAAAALKKYAVREFSLLQSATTSPQLSAGLGRNLGVPQPPDAALIDESGGGPTLRRLLFVTDLPSTTTDSPQTSGFIWFGRVEKTGPATDAVGTGSSASSIAWGVVGGWTVTGGSFCNSEPSFLCDLVPAVDLETVEPVLSSPFYDIGTWIFHGTGFTAAPFVFLTSSDPGNHQVIVKGALAPDGTVPALPLLGVAALAISLLAMGLAAAGRR